MNDEIKEILDKLGKKTSVYKFQINQGTSFNTDEYEASILLDYITNLQEKVSQYENPDDYTLFYMWLDEKAKDKMKKLKEENERLKEDITTMNNYIDKIQKENNILKENAEHNDKVVDKAKWNEMIYKSRNEKAIEYLGINEEILETCEIYDVNGIEVYKILRGNKWNEVEKAYLDDKPIGSDKE